jgi:ATP-dependent Clp protease adaptor protein ClpS
LIWKKFLAAQNEIRAAGGSECNDGVVAPRADLPISLAYCARAVSTPSWVELVTNRTEWFQRQPEGGDYNKKMRVAMKGITGVWRSGPAAMAGKDDGPGRNNDRNNDDEGRTGLVTKTRPKTKKPSLYKVLLLNDDFTPMEFVVLVLQRFFNKGHDDAQRIMLHVHHKGVGICGVYTFEVAEAKVTQVMDFSRQHGHPLKCTMEKE